MNGLSTVYFHIPTAYLTVGFLFMLVPAAAWLMLKERGSHAPAIWFTGGLLMGAGLILLGFRPNLSPWLSYFVGNSLLALGNMLHVHALRQEVGQRPSWWLLLLTYLLVMLPHEYFRQVLDSAYLRFTWTLGCLTVALAWTAWLAWLIVRREGSKSAYWLAGV